MAVHSPPPGPGCVVEYLQDNQPQLALILEEQGGRLRLFTQRGRETAMPASRLLPWTGPRGVLPSSRAEMEERLARCLEARQQTAQSIDVMEIWDLAQGELASATVEWFAGLIWDHPDEDRLAAMGRRLLEAKTHFKFQPPLFLIHPEETVTARLAEEAAARERQELVLAGQDFFVDLWKKSEAAKPPAGDAAAKLADLLRRRISGKESLEEESLWRNLTRRIPEHPHQALLLAQAWGLVPTHYNYHLDQAGYDWMDDWSTAHASAIAVVRQEVESRRTAPAVSGLISVDSSTTQDIDDAFALSRTADGGFELVMAIACPCLGWPWDSDLDAAVADRASSLYLPEGVSHMLPECLGTDLFSLRANQPRPALILRFRLDSSGLVTHFTPETGWVELQDNTRYSLVEQAIESSAEPFFSAHALAALLRAARIRQGAVVFDQPDPDFRLEGQGAEIRVLKREKQAAAKANLLVSELMILANAEVARWAIDQQLPLLYRTQNAALPQGSAGEYHRPEDMYRMARTLANAALRTRPEPHSSLGVKAYASVTSPLRRYVDLLNMGQVVHVLRHGGPRLDKMALDSGLPQWRARMEAVSRIQRFRTRYWKLEYLRQQGKNHAWPAILVDETPHQAVFALPGEQVLVRAPKRLVGEKCLIGSAYRLRLARVDPLLNEIKVLDAMEE